MPYYLWYELNHAALSPVRAMADMTRLYFRNPLNPMSGSQAGKSIAAWCELFERVTRRYGKPTFGISDVRVSGERVAVRENVVWSQPFCNLIRFEKIGKVPAQPKLLIVAPMSGHYATLLRGTVADMLPTHDVYVTDWVDARMVPVADGRFDLDDYIDYVISMVHHLGGDVHLMAVCQPSVPVLAAVAQMAARKDPCAPLTMTLMGGPIDTRENPTSVNILAQERGTEWFARNVITHVPFPHPGVTRQVYPGFLQLTGFMSMNLDRHMNAHRDFFKHLVDGDGDSAEKHKDFYDEYMAVMDLTAEFYLQTVEEVFVRHSLPNGTFEHRGERIDCAAITRTALMTVEGERDDISGLGQTKAAHALCSGLADEMKVHYVQPRVGHYGVFNGSRFRSDIAPRISDFILSHDTNARRARDTRPAARRRQKPIAKRGSTDKSRRLGKSAFLDKANGRADDLKAISGIGPKLENALHEMGVFHYWQIASWTAAHIRQVDDGLAFKGRVMRDNWVSQARALAGT